MRLRNNDLPGMQIRLPRFLELENDNRTLVGTKDFIYAMASGSYGATDVGKIFL